MRIVFTSAPSYSHLVPVVLPTAVAAQAAGHEVVVATGPDLEDEILRHGLKPMSLPNVLSHRTMTPERMRSLGIDPTFFDDFGRKTMSVTGDSVAALFAGEAAKDFAEDLITAFRDFPPDLVVRESTEYGSYYATEALGLPRVSIDTSPLVPYAEPAVLDMINKQRGNFGLGEIDDPLHPHRDALISVVPEAFYPDGIAPAALHTYRPPTMVDRTPLDPAIADLPDDTPLVLATLGSGASMAHREDERTVFDSIIEAFGDLDVTGVVALGKDIEPEDWKGARPDNIHLVSFVQQRLLLPACDAFLTHSGFSGVRESIEAGVPMVNLPVFAEQSYNAARVAELGMGKRINIEDATRESIREAVRTVLDDPGYRHRVRKFQRQMLALPHFEQLATDLSTVLDRRADQPFRASARKPRSASASSGR